MCNNKDSKTKNSDYFNYKSQYILFNTDKKKYIQPCKALLYVFFYYTKIYLTINFAFLVILLLVNFNI